MNASEQLRYGAERILADGWAQGQDSSWDDGYPHCLVTSLPMSIANDYAGLSVVSRYIDRKLVFSLTQWNDTPGRTAGHVVGVMRAASGMGYWGAGLVKP